MSWPTVTLHERILRAPLVPVAILATLGIIVDRIVTMPWWAFLPLIGIGLPWWMFVRRGRWFALAAAIVGFGGFYHHEWRNVYPSDDVGFLTKEEPRLVRLRGRIADEPRRETPLPDPLKSMPESARTHAIVRVETIEDQSVSGRVAMTSAGDWPGAGVGDLIEVVGWLAKPRTPDNPGERDWAAELADQRIRAQLFVRGGRESVRLVEAGGGSLIDRGLSRLRLRAREHFGETLPEHLSGTASALLLGDGSALTRDDWQKYIRTGVVHVLAVSGQHLAVLASFGWFVLRAAGVRRRWGALAVAVGIVLYSMLAGGRPPVLRSAVIVVAASGATLIRRVALPENTFALAWLAVIAVNPTDVNDAGCLFSFLSVAVLVWGVRRWFARPPVDPVERLIELSRPAPIRWLRAALRVIWLAYGVSLACGIVVLPLTASRYHLVSPAGILIGPPAVAFASVALVAGFVQLLVATVLPPIIAPFAFVTRWSLAGLTTVVEAADHLPGSHFYVGDIGLWWLIGFYVIFGAILWWPAAWSRPLTCTLIGMSWAALGLAIGLIRPHPDGLVVHFLAVGHGGCAVIETPDGRVLIYDAGSMSGPEVTRRVIAPFLWHRGIDRIDEVFLSHGDLDHFNGLPALMERFPIGRISVTPSFAAKPTPGVRETIAEIRRRGFPTRIRRAGDSFAVADLTIDVLHPPDEGPSGPENNRSMVLALRHHGRTILLTGDLDAEGRAMLLTKQREFVDVLMAPHHGGKTANPPHLAEWCRPELVIACSGPMDRTGQVQAMYEGLGCRYLGTWPHGAVTVSSRREGLTCDTFRGRQAFPVGGVRK